MKNTWKIATSLLALSLALAGCSAEPVNEDFSNETTVEKEQVVKKEEKPKDAKKKRSPLKKEKLIRWKTLPK